MRSVTIPPDPPTDPPDNQYDDEVVPELCIHYEACKAAVENSYGDTYLWFQWCMNRCPMYEEGRP